MRVTGWALAGMILIALSTGNISAREALDISGTWRIALDREDRGTEEGWWKSALAGADTLNLPGTLQEQGFGDEITSTTQWMGTLYDRNWNLRKEFLPYTQPDEVKVPFWLNPERTYTGVAWYQRSIRIPSNWSSQNLRLFFEKVQWSTTVWLNDEMIGSNDSLSAPHIHKLGIREPGEYRLTVRIDNSMLYPIRADAHSITDSTQTNWNGIIGRMEVEATAPVYIKDAQAYGNIEDKTATVKVRIGNATNEAGEGTLSVNGHGTQAKWDADGGEAEITVAMGEDAGLWDEFKPVLHDLKIELTSNAGKDTREIKFGLREIKSRDARFYLNNRRVFFRGTHEGCQFPLTGYPPTDVDSWRRIMAVCKEYGLNHIRFHSWCPPEAAFTAADEAGIYLQPEASNWGQYGRDGTELYAWVNRETERMIEAYGNHPSFLMFSTGNEPAGNWAPLLTQWCNDWKQKDPRRVYASQTGRGSIARSADQEEPADYIIAIGSRGGIFRGDRGWFGRDFSAATEGLTVPGVSHETGQWCAFPNFAQMDQYTGSLKPKNYEIFRDDLKAHGLLDRAHDFMMASGRFQVACYKEEIEGLLRSPGMGGFQLLDLHDYPGQGTALVGPLNVFWESKGYVSGDEFRKFCDVTVPLVRMSSYIYTTRDAFEIPAEIAHFGAEAIENATPVWKILDAAGKTITAGELPTLDIPIENGTKLGVITASLADMPAPAKYQLSLGLKGREDVVNDWEFWVYPPEVSPDSPENVLVTRSFTEAMDRLAQGGRVLLLARDDEKPYDNPPIGRLPIFWSRLMGPKWERTLGLVCDPAHPALAEFATDDHYDWQWQDITIPYYRGINLDHLPGEIQPIVQLIDDWNRNYKLAMVFEAQVGNGRLLMCAADLSTDLEKRPAARQLRRSLMDYAASREFNPKVKLTAEQFMSLRFDNAIMKKLGAVAKVAGEEEQEPAPAPTGNQRGFGFGRRPGPEALIDGNPNTTWQASGRFGGGSGREEYIPREVTITFDKPVPMQGVVLMNNQGDRNHAGDIRGYALQMSEDGDHWREVLSGELDSTFDPQILRFDGVQTAQYIKFSALSGFGNDRSISLAEFSILYAGDPLDDSGEPIRLDYSTGRTSTEEMVEGN